MTHTVTRAARPTPLTPNQIRGFWAAWGGWALDGMDSFIYSLVLVPTLLELLPRTGIPATPANVGFYGSVLFALFLIGWGLSMLWGPIADRFGRVPTLTMTILCYSLFTLLCGVVTNIWQLAAFRLLAGIGIGGEWFIGATYVAEEWPEDRRKAGAGYMHTGYYFGFFLAALANYFVGAKYGWRWMFVVGGTPALLVTFIRYGVSESAAWKARVAEQHRPAMSEAFAKDLCPGLRAKDDPQRAVPPRVDHRLVGRLGLRADVGARDRAARRLYRADAARLASYGTMVLSAGTILGCLVLPTLAEALGRRLALAGYFVVMFFSIAVGFGYVFFLPNALAPFFIVLFFLGLGGANFAMYTLWLPEQYPTIAAPARSPSPRRPDGSSAPASPSSSDSASPTSTPSARRWR
jgi:MFS family permease